MEQVEARRKRLRGESSSIVMVDDFGFMPPEDHNESVLWFNADGLPRHGDFNHYNPDHCDADGNLILDPTTPLITVDSVPATLISKDPFWNASVVSYDKKVKRREKGKAQRKARKLNRRPKK